MAAEEKSMRDEERHAPVLRFTKRQRIEHHIMAILFIVLTATGLPQKFYDAAWAGWMVRLFGEVDFMRWLHSMAGFGFAGFTGYFALAVSIDVLRGGTALS